MSAKIFQTIFYTHTEKQVISKLRVVNISEDIIIIWNKVIVRRKEIYFAVITLLFKKLCKIKIYSAW